MLFRSNGDTPSDNGAELCIAFQIMAPLRGQCTGAESCARYRTCEREKMNPMQNKTPEERKAIAAKGHATARLRREREEAERQDALKYAGGLREEIAALEAKLSALERQETMSVVSSALTGKVLLRANEIAQAALPLEKVSGVYFLVDGDEVVYVGQAVNVYSRVGQHTDKRFDRYAFVP